MANTQININANGTKTLLTAGKYCDRNIDVNVDVATVKPTQFTNLYDPANVTIDTKVSVSSNVVSYSSNSEVNVLRIPYHHKAGEPIALRMRGIGTVRSNFVAVGYKADGTTRANHWYLDSDSYWGKNYDEYGDMVLTAKGSAASTEWYFFEINFQYDGMSSATTALTGPIVTINEPIGNGGYTG